MRKGLGAIATVCGYQPSLTKRFPMALAIRKPDLTQQAAAPSFSRQKDSRCPPLPTSSSSQPISCAPTPLGCYGNEVIDTPNIDALADRACVFQRMFAAYPVCAPNRASLVTGRYPSCTACAPTASACLRTS